MQSLPEDLRFTAAFDASTQAEVVWVPEEPREEDVRVAAPRRRPTSPHPPLPAPAARQPKEPAARPAAGGTCPAQLPPELLPSPAAEPLWVSAFCGRRPGLLHWVPACATGSGSGGDGKAAAGAEDEVVFAGGALIVGMQAVEGGRQRYLRGHSAPVCALAVSADGGRLASAEEGPGAEVRLWDFRRGCCLATVPGE